MTALPLLSSMPTATQPKKNTKTDTSIPSRERMEGEMMVARETDQWMTEHYKTRA